MLGCFLDLPTCIEGGRIAAQAWVLGLLPQEFTEFFTAIAAIGEIGWFLIGLALGIVYGKFGWPGIFVVLTIGGAAVFIRRRSEPAGEFGEMESDPHPVPQPRPRRTLRDLFKRN